MRPHAMLFSAYAEVFPRCTGRTTPLVTFLCLRRGVSPLPAVQEVQRLFSLPTQRCFRIQILKLRSKKLFSAYAEVFPPRDLTVVELVAFLCLRRGVSRASAAGNRRRAFSLPTQRCFYLQLPYLQAQELFSAYAEVFPYTDLKAKVKEAFLCLRRGVSPSRPHGCGARRFSLPTQRCFQSKCCRKPPTSLFSAYAEVFLSSTALSPSTGTFLCLRRGVSQAFDQPITPPGFSLPTQRCFYV